MPTENRSSNTENLPCPFCAGRVDPEGWLRGDGTRGPECESCGATAPTLSVWNSANPTTQPHPDPIAWMVGTAFWWTKEEAERDAAATGLPIVGLGPMAGVAPVEQHQGKPVGEVVAFGKGLHEIAWAAGRMPKLGAKLYTHADPAEVERLRAKIEQLRTTLRGRQEQWSKLEIAMLAKLAEAQALLGAIAGWTPETRAAVMEAFQDELNDSASYAWYDAAIADLMKLVGALSATAEPSALTWACQSCLLEQPTDRSCDVCGGKTEPIATKS